MYPDFPGALSRVTKDSRKTQACTSAEEESDESESARNSDGDGHPKDAPDISGFSGKKLRAFQIWEVNYDIDEEENEDLAERSDNRGLSNEKLTRGKRGFTTQGSQPEDNDNKSSSDSDDSKSSSSSSPSIIFTSSSVESVCRGAAAGMR